MKIVKERQITLITDVPTPYRAHLFNILDKEFHKIGIKFSVLFFRNTVKYRYWSVDTSGFNFDYKIDKGVTFVLGRRTFHFNPRILLNSFKSKKDITYIIGAGWAQPTILFMLPLLRLKSQKFFFWLELNEKAQYFNNFLINKLRSGIINSTNKFIVPGRIAVEYLNKISPDTNRETIILPNLIEESKFQNFFSATEKRELKKRLFGNDNLLSVIWPARLNESDKGIINFLSIIKDSFAEYNKNILILIAGEGPDRRIIQDFLDENKLSRCVKLLGFVDEEMMIEYYRSADLFLLPSIIDPNPLSVIEAMWSSLPLMISNSCGNYPEAIIDGENGWLLNLSDTDSVKNKWNNFINCNADELEALSRNSFKRAQEYFTSKKIIAEFVKKITN